MNSSHIRNKHSRLFVSLFLAFALVACLFVGESLAGGKGNKGGGGDDIILYNGNIVLRGGGGGKGKGKGGGGGNIVVANMHPQDQHVEMMPQMFDMWGGQGMGRRR